MDRERFVGLDGQSVAFGPGEAEFYPGRFDEGITRINIFRWRGRWIAGRQTMGSPHGSTAEDRAGGLVVPPWADGGSYHWTTDGPYHWRTRFRELGREDAIVWFQDHPEHPMPASLDDAPPPEAPRVDPQPAPAVFLCSKAELLRALDKDKSNMDYLNMLTQAGRLVLSDAENPVGHHRYAARFTDPGEHAKIVGIIGRSRERR